MNFSPLKDYLHGLKEEWSVPGNAMVVRIGHETVFENFENAKRDDVYWIYSATKVFTATLFCRFLEEGKLHLEDKVSDFLPEYKNLQIALLDGTCVPAKNELTLGHLVTMCGGLTYNIMHDAIRTAEDKSTVGVSRAVAKMPLIAEPGETFNYSLCHDVLAGVMEVAAGERFSDMIRRQITEPLGMTSTTFHPEGEIEKRFTPQYAWDGEKKQAVPVPCVNHFRFSPDFESGGAGLCSTLDDYSLLAETLANDGRTKDGYRLLKPETIAEMKKNRLVTFVQKQGFDRCWGARHRSYGYGLGVRTRIDYTDEGLSPLGEFGWDGAAGAYCMVDTENRISAFYVQHVLNMGPVYDVIHPTLRNLIYKCVKE